MRTILIGVFTIIILSSFLYNNVSGQKSMANRIQSGDLTYLGAFKLPDGVAGSDVKSWAWGGFAMTYYPDGDPGGPDDGYPGSIFATGHAWEYQVSEITIPTPVISTSKNVNALNTASTLQSFRDIMNVSTMEIPRVGLAYLPKQGSQTSDKLNFCYGEHMQESGTMTHGWCELNLGNPQIKSGWYLKTSHYEYNTNDYMFEIPSAWSASHTPGKILATGRFRDGGWSGQGPALYAISPWTQGNPPPSGTSLQYITLLKYTSTEDPESWDEATNHTMDDYHHSDEWSGAAWLTAGNKSAVVFVGTKGTGDCWYGDSNGPCYDCAGERGWWSTGFEAQFIFYDPDDLAKVAAGTIEPWEPQPYASLNVDQYLYHITSTQQWYHLGAACFDRTRGYLYVFEPYVEDDKPIIHVWKLNTASPTPTLTVTSPNGGEKWSAGSIHPITWSTTGTVGNVKIQYSTDNGASWSTVTSSTVNDGSYSWTVPGINSSQCLVRISETDGTPVDNSNSVFSITGNGGTGAEISLNREQLTFGVVTSGPTRDSSTFSIDNNGSGNLNWTISHDLSWLSCTPLSGTNRGIVTVTVDAAGLPADKYQGIINVNSANASNSPQAINVTLTVYNPGAAGEPFGVFATPQNLSTVRSSVPVTGWALDDVGVESVKIYRKQSGSPVYIGDAVFVEGARPDVEQEFTDYPMNYRAGWGYMMLTNFLPDGGNGTFTIYAIAEDKEGNQVTLGTKTITCDNATAVKPFGAIDTPAQGGTASGNNFINWGWVLTPQPNSIPLDGSTINVFVDGVNLGHPTYNIYREDIAGLFPGYVNSSGAAGYFYLDTTAYANGVHTIQWTATNDAGNTDGIGSRYFTIQNTNDAGERKAAAFNVQNSKFTINKDNNIKPDRYPIDYSNPIRFKKGYNKNSLAEDIYPGNNGVLTIDIKELERLEIHFSESISNEVQQTWNLSTLPIGSSLNIKKGVFYWQLGVGFVGRYQLVFLQKDKYGTINKRIININILPKF